jgi:hypothetical protein
LVPQPCLTAAVDEASLSPIELIRERYVASMLPASLGRVRKLKELSEEYAGELAPDGSWPDVDYQSKAQSDWSAAEHLDRTQLMARAAALNLRNGDPDQVLDAKVLRALKYWTLHDYQNQNWWWNQIGQIPEDRMAILNSYLLDGEQWLVRGDIIDYSTVGREITRKGKLVAPGRSTGKRHPVPSPGENLPGVVAMLAAVPTPRQ